MIGIVSGGIFRAESNETDPLILRISDIEDFEIAEFNVCVQKCKSVTC